MTPSRDDADAQAYAEVAALALQTGIPHVASKGADDVWRFQPITEMQVVEEPRRPWWKFWGER